MPDFTARVASGVALEEWVDSPPAGGYDRTNPVVGHPHRHLVGTTLVEIEVRATVGGIEMPDDSLIGGRLFTAWMAEGPAVTPITFPTAGRSSQARFTPVFPGHYVFGFRREGGGATLLHITVREA